MANTIETQYKDIEDLLKEKKRELEQAEKRLEEVVKMTEDKGNIVKELLSINKEINDAKEKRKKLKEEIDIMESNFNESFSDKNFIISGLNDNIDNLNKEIKNKENIITSLTSEFEIEKNKINGEIKKFEDEKSFVKKEISNLTTIKSHVLADIDSGKEKLSVVNNSITEVNSSLLDCLSELEVRQNELKEANLIKENINELISAKTQLNSEINSLRGNKEKQIADMELYKQVELQKIDEERAELQILSGEMSIREAKIKETLDHLNVIIPQLAAIDPKKMSKIDLSLL